MDSRHWHLGLAPHTHDEWEHDRLTEAEAALEATERRMSEHEFPTEPPSLQIDPPFERDPVTPGDIFEWRTKANWKRDKEFLRMHQMTWEEINRLNNDVQEEVNRQAFAKRFAHWVDRGCPLDKETT